MNSLARTLGRSIIEKTATLGRPMSEDECFTLFALASPIESEKMDDIHVEMMGKHPIYAILHHRIAATTKADVSVTAKLFLAEIASGNPGNAVMLAAVIADLSENGTRTVELSDIIDAFPMAVPTSEVFGEAWDTQKGGKHDGVAYDNALDHAWAWIDSASE